MTSDDERCWYGSGLGDDLKTRCNAPRGKCIEHDFVGGVCGYESQLEPGVKCTFPASHTGYHSFWGRPINGMESIAPAPTAPRAGALEAATDFVTYARRYFRSGAMITSNEFLALEAILRNTELDKGLIVPNSALEALLNQEKILELHRLTTTTYKDKGADWWTGYAKALYLVQEIIKEADLTPAPAEEPLPVQVILDWADEIAGAIGAPDLVDRVTEEEARLSSAILNIASDCGWCENEGYMGIQDGEPIPCTHCHRAPAEATCENHEYRWLYDNVAELETYRCNKCGSSAPDELAYKSLNRALKKLTGIEWSLPFQPAAEGSDA